MDRIKVAPTYSDQYFEIESPSPLSDNTIETLIQEVISGKLDKDITDNIYTNFKHEMANWIFSSNLNKLTGINSFNRINIINGCTQFIDDIYMKGSVQVIYNDYRYHERLGLAHIQNIESLIPNIPLIIAMPFPSVGAPHLKMEKILEECVIKNIDVHIDGAWISCCRDIIFNFDHPSIKSVGISLSKGLGLGWNRIGLRWTKQTKSDSITIMNDFRMNNRALVMIGLHFIRSLPSDYLWNTYGNTYYKICNDFNLIPTNAIHLALRDGSPVGISPLLRYVAEQ